MTLRVSSKMWEMYWEWCLCACREIWSDSRNSSKSAVARQGHGAVRFEIIAQTLFIYDERPECLKNKVARGGNVRVIECVRLWSGVGTASRPPRLPHPLPPY